MALLTQRAMRQRAEETVRAREASLRTSYERIRQLARRVINAQETARITIAQDLHDDVAQRLACVSMIVSRLKNSSGDIQGPAAQQAFEELASGTESTVDGIRRLAHELHPATLRILGLAPALRAHCNEVQKVHDIDVQCVIDADIGHVHPDVAVCFFRIAQEALRNATVHGGARRLSVSLTRVGAEIEMRVTDDGSGFDLDAVRRSGGGLGLVSMEERANAARATMWIVTAEGAGTTIHVRGAAEPQAGGGSREIRPGADAAVDWPTAV
jgi:two-component system sensor histidine kinase UhpB